jgi:MGT family glycosyltransferase
LIYVSLGTVFNANDDFYRQCFRAFADSRYCVALAIGEKTDPRRLEPIPDNFIVRSFMPQLQVLRCAALFITHGGMNSVNEALFEGIPLLVVPQGADQFLIAGQVQRLGAGKLLRVRGASAANLRSAAEAILADPAYRQRSEALGARLHQAGGAMAAADAIDVFKRRYQLA